jgi:hypothetical protein
MQKINNWDRMICQKVEENLARKQSQRIRGRRINKGKGVYHEKAHKTKNETEKPHSHSES